MNKIVIVGGVAGGASAAARLRRLDENAKIVIFERSGYISYANCGLPYYVGGEITEEKSLTLQTPQSFFSRFAVEAHVHHEVVSINAESNTVTVKNLDNGTIFEEDYDYLILSPGAKPTVPPITGMNQDGVFTLRTVEDTLKIKTFIKQSSPKSAVIIGAGYVGIEMAENLNKLGIDVTLIEYSDHLLGTLDSDMASFVNAEFMSNGVKTMVSTLVTAIEQSERNLTVKLADKSPVSSDMVIVAVGVTPDTELAKDAGIKVGLKGSIVVNKHMQTSIPNIYAVGDAVQVQHYISGKESVISLAGPANKQGRIAADNICGIKSKYQGTQGSSVIKVFDLTVGTTGMSESYAKYCGYNYEKIIVSPPSHATYYPGSRVMTIKLLYDRESQNILGAQIVGYDGVDKRIDVIATAIRAKLKVTSLAELELAYAPAYSSAKDPVNMVGFVAENIEQSLVKQFYYEDIRSLQSNKDVFLLDTRTKEEYSLGHVEGFVNIPVDSLRDNIRQIPVGLPVYIMCQSGLRSYIACRILSQFGFDCYNFTGGYRFYKSVNTNTKQLAEVEPCGVKI